MKKRDIVIDFDGTCVEYKFPQIGRSIGAEPVLRALVAAGHRLILSTMRSDMVNKIENKVLADHLQNALEWFKERQIPLYGIQINPSQKGWTGSPKVFGHLYIDDAALGCPLVYVAGGRPYVDWEQVYYMLQDMGYLKLSVVEEVELMESILELKDATAKQSEC